MESCGRKGDFPAGKQKGCYDREEKLQGKGCQRRKGLALSGIPGDLAGISGRGELLLFPLRESPLRPAGDHPLPGRPAGISGQLPGLFSRGGRLIHPPNPKRESGASLSCQAVLGVFRPDSPGAGTSLHLLLFKGPAMKWERSGRSPGGRKGSLAGKEIGHSAKERRLNCAGRISG